MADDALLNVGITVSPNDFPAAMQANYDASMHMTAAGDTLLAGLMKQDTAFNSLSSTAQYLYNWENKVTEQNSLLFAVMKKGSDEVYDKFIEQLQQSAKSTETVTTATTAAAQAAEVVEPAWKQAADQLVAMGASLKEVAAVMQQFGATEEQVAAYTANLTGEQRSLAGAADENSQKHLSLFEVMRGGRLAIAGILADMALMHIASGQQLPDDLQILVKGLQTTIDMATGTSFAFDAFLSSEAMLGTMAGPVGLAIGAIGGVILALATNAMAGNQALKDVNKTLDDLAAKSATKDMLATLVNLTDQEAQKAQQDAQQNAELATALKARADAQEHLQDVMAHPPTSQGAVAVPFDPVAQAKGQLNLAQIQLDQALAAQKDTDANKALHDELARDTETGAGVRLSTLSGATQDATKQFLTFASTHADVAQKAQSLADAITGEQQALDRAKAAGDTNDAILNSSNQLMAKQRTELNLLIGATNAADDAQKQHDELLKKLPDDIQKVTDAQAQLAYEQGVVADQAVQYAQQEAKAYENAAQARVDAERQAQQQIESIHQQEATQALQLDNYIRDLAQQEAKDHQSWTDKQADVDLNYNNKLFDQAFSYNQQVENIQHQEVVRQTDLADQIYQIKFDLQQRINAITFQAGESEETAKTYAQVLQIRERANFEIQQATNKANEEIAIDQKKNSQTLSDDAFKLQQLQENYQHELDVDLRTKTQELNNAQRSYDEQVAAAKQSNQNQISDLIARVQIEGGYVIRSGDTFKVVERGKLDDVQTKLKQQETAIDQRYKQEIQSIELAKDKFVDAENQKIAKLDETIAKLQQEILLASSAPSASAAVTSSGLYNFAQLGNQMQGLSGYLSTVNAPVTVTIQGNIIGMDNFQSLIQQLFNQMIQQWSKGLAP